MKKIQLIRFFTSEDRAKQFLSGKIFMNYLGYFWGPDLDKLSEEKEREHWDKKKITPAKYGQDDFFEGAVVLQNKENSFVPEEMRDMCVGNVILRVESYRYCNLLCMCAVDYDDERKKINLPDVDSFKAHDFGEFVVIIKDMDEFLKRIDSALSSTGSNYVYGRVEYRNLIGDYSLTERHSALIQSDICPSKLSQAMEEGHIIDVFEKENLLKQQREWRICLDRFVSEEEKYFLELNSDLNDIAELVSADKLNNELLKLHSGYSYGLVQPDKDSKYLGNMSREAFRKKVCEDGKYRILFNIG